MLEREEGKTNGELALLKIMFLLHLLTCLLHYSKL